MHYSIMQYIFRFLTVGGSSDSQLGVCGDSAGGKLASVACHEVKEHIQFAVSWFVCSISCLTSTCFH